MTPQHPVRRAERNDAHRVATLLDAFQREFDVPSPGEDVLAARLETLADDPGFVTLVTGDPVVGFAMLTLRPGVWSDGPVGLLEELYVVPALRNRRMGEALLHASEDVVRASGGIELQINVDGEDTDTRRFYERHGYSCRHEGEEEPMLFYYRDLGDDADR